MNNYSREVDSAKMEQSKQRTMTYVMDTINQPQRSSWLRHLYRPILVPTLAFIIALALILQPGEGPVDKPFTVSAQESQTLAEISYLSSSLIAANITVADHTFQFLANNDTTEFEDNTDEINMYFDMLKVFLDDDLFSNNVTITLLEDSPFTQLMEFSSNGIAYQFYIAVNDGIISGELLVNNAVFTVSGRLEEEDDEYSIELEATSGNDYVRISYQTENNSEVETKYEVESQINGVTATRQIKVSFENDEAKVEIEEGENSYQLKRELEDGAVQYKLEYTINNQEGEAVIIETTDTAGAVTYSYQVKEGDVEKEIEKGRPDYDYEEEEDDEDEEDDDTPGKSGEDNNQEDPPGNDDDEEDTPGNQEDNSDGDDTPGSSGEDNSQNDAPGSSNNANDEDPKEQSSHVSTTITKKSS
jgi:hypothetical protein